MLRAYEAFLIKKGTIKSQYVPFDLNGFPTVAPRVGNFVLNSEAKGSLAT